MRRGRWKLIRSSDPELFDLAADPAEVNNLYATEGSVAADMSALIDHALAGWSASGTPAQATAAPLDPEALTRLASLGYVGGAVSTAHWNGPSPRSKVHLESELLLLQDVMLQRSYRQALASAANVLRDDPGNRLALTSAADASAGLRDFDAAKRFGRELLARYPEFVPGVVTQARVLVALKDFKSSELILRDGLEKSPKVPVLVYSLAMTLLADRRPGEAQALVEKALEVKEADPRFHMLLALCRASVGDAAGARSALREAIAQGYDDVETLRSDPLLEPLRRIPGFEAMLTSKKGA
jgi:tetratricopeptide (TPR) repeat protein